MVNNKMNVHFSSATDLWATPQEFFDKYNSKFNFETDVCANAENTKCATFYDKEMNGLAQDWKGACWMNPPYGRGIGLWVKKAFESAQQGATVVCLLPARTDTAWWHDYCANGEVEFIRGRLKFGGHKNSAPFPSAVVTFKPTQKCGGDGIANTSCRNPKHIVQHMGSTYCVWECENCGGRGRDTWD